MEYKISVNGKNFNVRNTGDHILINDTSIISEVHKISDSKYLIIKDREVYNIDLVSQNAKHFDLKVNNKPMQITVMDHLDLLLEEMGMKDLEDDRISEIASPMPGSILSILVKEGDIVKKGDSLLILEAMKMENIIKSPIDGSIEKVVAEVGDNVNKEDLLIKFVRAEI